MPLTIWKFPLEITDELELDMPKAARVLCVQTQFLGHPKMEKPCLWAIVDSGAETEKRKFAIRGTGHPLNLPDNAKYIGTFQSVGGVLIFHVFEEAI